MSQVFKPILVLPLVLLIVGCAPCSDKVVAESLSPDRTLAATWFVRDCGATTEFSTMVSVHRPDITFRDDAGIVFVAKGRGSLKLEWTGPRGLKIECVGCERKMIFKEVTVAGDVDISY